jgi:hypothetical protein
MAFEELELRSSAGDVFDSTSNGRFDRSPRLQSLSGLRHARQQQRRKQSSSASPTAGTSTKNAWVDEETASYLEGRR